MAAEPHPPWEPDPEDLARGEAIDATPVGDRGRVSASGARRDQASRAPRALRPALVELGAAASHVTATLEREAGGWNLAHALEAAASVEDLVRRLRHAQILAAGAVADAYERPESTEAQARLTVVDDDGPLTFGSAARLGTDGEADTTPAEAVGTTPADIADVAAAQGDGPGTTPPAPGDDPSTTPPARGDDARATVAARRGGRRRAYRSAADALRVRLRLSGAESRRRVATARDVLPRTSITGERLAPECAAVGTLVADGAADAEAVGHVLRALREAREHLRPACEEAENQVREVEQVLVDAAREVDVEDVRRLADRCVHLLDQDGPAPTEADLSALHGVFFSGRRDGLHQIKIVTDDVGRELLETIFATGTNPRVPTEVCDAGTAPEPGVDVCPGGAISASSAANANTNDNNDNNDADADADADETADGVGRAATSRVERSADEASRGVHDAARGPGGNTASAPVSQPAEGPVEDAPREARTVARRRLDALLAACAAGLRARDLPATGGLPTQVMVTVGLDELRSGLGSAHLPYQGPVPATVVRRLACDADLIPVVMGNSGRVLDVGRSRRLFPDQIRRAIVARDGGCAFPGCHVPAPWCEAHHVTAWWEGGVTSVDNGVLLCSYHHHLVHEGHWRLTVPAGMPLFHPPWDEPTATGSAPLRNRYHRPPLPPRRT